MPSGRSVLLNTEQTRDYKNGLKNRRIEIFFRNRYISIGNNASMKDKINKFNDKQSANTTLRKAQPKAPSLGQSKLPQSSVALLGAQRSALIHSESKKQIIDEVMAQHKQKVEK